MSENLPDVSDVIVGKVVNPRAMHHHVLRFGKHGTRHTAYIPLGAAVLAKRWWQNHTQSRYGKFIAMAEAAGNHEAAAKWDELRIRFLAEKRQARHDRAEIAINIAKASPYVIGVGAFSELGLGICLAISERRLGAVGEPLLFTAHAVYWAVIAAGAAAIPVAIAAPSILLAVAWNVGRRHAMGMHSGWLTAPKDPVGQYLVLTADTVVLALKNLGIAAITRAMEKEHWQPTFTLLPVKSGDGYECEFSLPLGVTAGHVADKRDVLARNVHRAEIETWPSEGAPGHVKLFVANPGSISKDAPPYPLLESGSADVFEGVPVGVTPRGDAVLLPIVANNAVFGGLPGTGKSNAVRVVLLGCATDPLCQVEAYVSALNGDFDAYAPRLARYVKGLDDEDIEQMAARIEELYEEVGRREAKLGELGASKLTRQIAQQHPDMRPIVAAFSECHEIFGHPVHGKLAAEYATKLVKRGRKTGVVTLYDTQSARTDALPGPVVENVSVNVCFAVRNWRNNDGFLGDGSFAAGIRATELSPQNDRGTSIATGVSHESYELLRWYYVARDDDSGLDDATDVIARCLGSVARGTLVGGAVPAIEKESRDLLEDLAEVLGNERVKLRDVIALLREHAKGWKPYESMTATSLKASLKAEGVRTVNHSGTVHLDPEDVRDALNGRTE